MSGTTSEIDALLARLKEGDQGALAELFSQYQAALRRMIDIRLDPRLNGRVSPSDVLQETYLDALQRAPHYFKHPEMPFFVWLRLIAGQRLVDVHRHHLGAKMRNAGQEVSLNLGGGPGASSACLAAHLLGNFTSPSQAFERIELLGAVEDALNSLDPIDREVLSLRHFEELSNADTAAILGIEKAAASKRYIRALERLKTVLAGVPGLLGES
jgi:RNA polymerase sigma-70 factor (ECF subfamily)